MDWMQVPDTSPRLHRLSADMNFHDNRSVNAGCSATSDAISKTAFSINKFVREVRESRSEFDTISVELHSLDGVLDLLRYDAAFFPPSLAEHTAGVLNSCLALANELEGCISLLNRPEVPKAEKKSRWSASRDHIVLLSRTLGEYNLVLGLAADLVGVIKPQTGDGAEQGVSDDQRSTSFNEADQGDELATVTTRIHEASSDFEQRPQQSVASAKLGPYLHELQSQAIAAGDYVQSQLRTHRHGGSSSMGGGPDSAIDVSYDDSDRFSAGKGATKPPPSTSISFESWEEGLNEFVGELSEMPIQAIRAPAIPPRSASRLSHTVACSARDRPTSPVAPRSPAQASYYTPVTELPEQIEELPSRPETRAHSRRSSIFGQVLYSVWENPRADVPSPARPMTSGGEMRHRDHETGLLRRSGSKLSTTLRSLGLRRPSLQAADDTSEMGLSVVFGVPLARSIQVAKGIANTKHGNGGSSSRSTHEYPLCVLRCVYHVRSCGLGVPDVFGVDGDRLRLGKLKETFNSAETSYGKELDWSLFTVHDAADLVLLFLSELPKPLIPDSVGKRWIALSRQATVRGGTRLDQGLDFWEEALMGIRGPSRVLFKLLLNLWGDIADAAEANEMTAERLAGRVIRPLMHDATARRHTDLMLGLAFIIRRRSEYNLAARGLARKSNAAF